MLNISYWVENFGEKITMDIFAAQKTAVGMMVVSNNGCIPASTRTVKEYLTGLKKLLPKLYESLGSNNRLKTEGLSCFADAEYWEDIEDALGDITPQKEKLLLSDKSDRILDLFVAAHFENDSIRAPYRLPFFDEEILTGYLKWLPKALRKEIRDSLRTTITYYKAVYPTYLEVSISNLFYGVTKAFVEIYSRLSTTDKHRIDNLDDLLAIAAKDKLVSDLQRKYLISYQKKISADIQEISSRRIFKGFITWEECTTVLDRIAPKLSRELKEYLNEQHEIIREAEHGLKWIFKAFKLEPESFSKVIKLLNKHGVEGLYLDDTSGLKLLEDELTKLSGKERAIKIKSALSNLLRFHYDKGANDYRSEVPWALEVIADSSSNKEIVYFKNIYEHYPAMFDDLKTYYEQESNRTDKKKQRPRAICSQLQAINSIFNLLHSSLSGEQIDLLREEGINAFQLYGAALLKHFRQTIHQRATNGSMEISSTSNYHKVLNIVLSRSNIATTKSFRISQRRTSKLSPRKKQKKNYSLEEVVQLVATIELGILEFSKQPNDLVHLYIAKTIIKTAWNLTPTLEIECDDLFELDIPLNGLGGKTKLIRLYKSRGGGNTQWYKYDLTLDGLDSKGFVYDESVPAVWRDLELIANHTEELRAELPDTSILKKRIFLEKDSAGQISSPPMERFRKRINALLKSLGCSVEFSSQRIRNKGLNNTYRKVARDYKRYQKAGYHSIETFFTHYFRNDKSESQMRIFEATKIMADYFLRDVTRNVKIVKNKPSGAKQVPNGQCINQSPKVISMFNARNRNLRKSKGEPKIKKCADFAACLWCEHYRCVADADHVWRLLSYRDTVVQEMRSSALNQEGSESMQRVYIELLEQRVDEVLDDLRELNCSTVEEGILIHTKNGIHPAWKLVSGGR
ncbi:hypothetical protein L1D19_22470 [Vibrio natriegens]|uniref:hypothetical protein n=1 Tax=Vibrio natriegens TaxID=691 RepID=UPI001EFD496C|nr:hypothetical protein [Vibrio natriegens]MCG9702833.1 hypothetical protein [Vibrio natriegens]